MSSLIKKPNELDIKVRLKMLIFGTPGIGKTTLALSASKPLLISFDKGGEQRVCYQFLTDTVQVQDYTNILQVLNNEDLSNYDTLIIDTGGKMMDSMANYIISRYPNMARANGSLTLQGYGQRKQEFGALMKLIESKDKDVIFVCHQKTVQDGDNIRYVPLFGGSNYDDLATELDLIGYMEAQGRKRTITFDPTSHADGKNTCNMPPLMEIPCIVDEYGNPTGKNDFIQSKVVKAYRDRLLERSTEGQSYKSLMAKIDEDIASIATPEDADFFFKEKVKEYNHIGNSNAIMRSKFAAKVTELGFTYNKELNSYEKAAESK